jgi:predicted ATPase
VSVITRIEISGFKSFHNFAVDLLPFQVFIGPNGVGKTNLFDAIVLLSDLASDLTLEQAFSRSRGEPGELFTFHPDGTRADKMIFGVEVLIGRSVTEPGGKSLVVGSTRMRYELEIESRTEDGKESVYVLREDLFTLAEAADKWMKEHVPTKNRKNWAVREKRPPYIATQQEKDGSSTIFRNQDAPGGGREAFTVGQLDKTVLSASNALRFPTAYAVKQEMQNWRFLQLNPSALRNRSESQAPTTLLPDGSNLAAVLGRLSKENDKTLPAVLKDMSKMIPEMKNLSVKSVTDRGDSVVEVELKDGSKFSSRVLSDGTLRLLALVSLKNDPAHRGVLCFEEPENGVQPQRLKQILDVLYALATNFDSESGDGFPNIRQVLINTHSPGLLANVPANSLFFVSMKNDTKGRETRVIPVRPVLIADDSDQFYTWEQVKQYLDSDPLNKKREELGL